MPRYYCDYCDTYLTHDSPSVRKQHNAGYKHKANVRSYYQQFEEQQTQSLIDQKIKEHLGQTAAYQQVGAAYNPLLFAQRPRLPVLPAPVLPVPGMQMPGSNPFAPGMRPVLLRPMAGVPGYISAPAPQQMVVTPPGAPSLTTGQLNGLPRHPTMISSSTIVMSSAINPPSSGSSMAAMLPPASYPPSATAACATSGAFDTSNVNASVAAETIS